MQWLLCEIVCPLRSLGSIIGKKVPSMNARSGSRPASTLANPQHCSNLSNLHWNPSITALPAGAQHKAKLSLFRKCLMSLICSTPGVTRLASEKQNVLQ
jgi:hypothetical protein